MGGISGDLCAGDPVGRPYVDGDRSLLRLHPGAAGSGNGPVFPAVPYSAGSPGSKAGESRDYLWVLAGVLLLVQLVLAVLMVYGDGDDAYYVAISAAAEESGRMYQKIPYTGMHTELDVRHGLAPFPIVDRMAGPDDRHHYGDRGEDSGAGRSDLHDLRSILSSGKQGIIRRRGRIPEEMGVACIFTLYGSAGAFRRLFLLYCREFYDCQEQTGEGCIGKYPDPMIFSCC